MLLSQTAEYALRAMAWMAIQTPEQPVRARDMSEATQIPLHYLSKILRRLVLAGLLTSQKGQGGGFVLARPPEQIRFQDILIALDLDTDGDESRCAFGWGACGEANPCPLHGAWSQLKHAMQSWAADTTLDAVRGTKRREAGDKPHA
ncbi:MAG: Rrf2 family transcriptional regulator [Myxococcales bacterium]|nr:Rrf2 family transcriptional regulator [Myxococcales bacterium]MDH5305549.1 Rrf2 family transcriptional regulator [Myxococcales bacterium]MDH5565210.1 Rrf2 family transcriptional regulator [Myxococcales bacterium]